MPMINIEDAYILDETGAQVDQVTGLYFKNENASDTEKAQARANIGAGGSNDNLLDNACFVGGGSQLGDGVFPINQRGQTSYSGGGYGIDRWKTWDGSDTIVLTADGVKYKSPNGNGIFQYFPYFPCGNDTCTFSVKIGGTIYPITLLEGQDEARGYGTGFEFLVNRSNKTVGVISANTELLLQAFKLEKGTVSTLANDAPPDFGEELRKCQQYLFIRDYAQNDVIANGLTNNLTMFLPVSMRSGGSPQMTFTVTPYVIGNGVISTPTSVGLVSVNGNQVQIYAPTTESHSAQTIVLYAGAATRMTINNEL